MIGKVVHYTKKKEHRLSLLDQMPLPSPLKRITRSSHTKQWPIDRQCGRLHELQRVLGRHAPQRNEQSKRRRNQHNRRLELGRVEHPLLDVGEHVVAFATHIGTTT